MSIEIISKQKPSLAADSIINDKLELLSKEAEKIPSMPQLARVMGVNIQNFHLLIMKYQIITDTILEAEMRTWERKRAEYEQVQRAFMTGENLRVVIAGPETRRDKYIPVTKEYASAAFSFWAKWEAHFNVCSLTAKLNKYFDMKLLQEFKTQSETEGGLLDIRKRIVEKLDEKTGVKDRASLEDRSFRNKHLQALEIKTEKTDNP